jgi:C4-dicarboxylate-specific signal transduction histidine kinase
MDADFVRDKLFHPFATTKGLGYGIGVYESRDFATSLGGQLEVTSQLGRGTIMRMRLPAVVS